MLKIGLYGFKFILPSGPAPTIKSGTEGGGVDCTKVGGKAGKISSLLYLLLIRKLEFRTADLGFGLCSYSG